MIYRRIKYPDGQISCEILDYNSPVIRERINSYEDLFFVRSLAQALENVNEATYLYIPCLFGQRSDRKFAPNKSFDLKIVAEVLNSCNFSQVKIFDPHSDVSLALINKSVKESPFNLVKQAVKDIPESKGGLVLVSPDAGAYKKVFEFGEQLLLPVVAAVKHRDLDGHIDLSFIGDVKDKECLIVDDLCDGGFTFIKLGEALKQQGASKVYLYVSHGYFSRGFDELQKVIDHIYCSNSVSDIGYMYPYLTQYKVI